MAKLDGRVRRNSLLARLRDERAARVILVTAPAGSGKTTLLRQWAEDDPRPTGWVNAQPAFADPGVLVREIARATATALEGGPISGIQPSLRGPDAFRNLSRLCQAAALDGQLHGARHFDRVLRRRDRRIHQHTIRAQFHGDGAG